MVYPQKIKKGNSVGLYRTHIILTSIPIPSSADKTKTFIYKSKKLFNYLPVSIRQIKIFIRITKRFLVGKACYFGRVFNDAFV